MVSFPMDHEVIFPKYSLGPDHIPSASETEPVGIAKWLSAFRSAPCMSISGTDLDPPGAKSEEGEGD